MLLVLRDPALPAVAIQAAAALVLAGYVVRTLAGLASTGDVRTARATLTDGIVVALGLMVPATILRTLAARTWTHIFALAFVLALRIVLKKFLLWERARV